MGLLVRLVIGFGAGVASLAAIAPGVHIVFGEHAETIGGGAGGLAIFAMIGLAAASPTSRLALGRSLKVVGACFWAAVLAAIVLGMEGALAEGAPPPGPVVVMAVQIFGIIVGGILFTIGHLLTRKPEPGAPGLLARSIVPSLARFTGGLISSRRVDAHRRLTPGIEDGVAGFDESLPYLRGFNAYYRRHIAGWLEEQEGRRKEALRHRIKVLMIGLPIMAAITLLTGDLIEAGGFWGTVIGWLMIFGWIGVIVAAFSKSLDLSDTVKKFMIEQLTKFFDLQHIEETRPIDLSFYRELELLPPHREAKMREAFTGQRGDVAMMMAEVVAYTYRGTQWRKRRRRVAFSGALLQFTYRKRFRGRTIAMSDRGLIGNLIKQGLRSEKRIRLENQDFEDHFEVFGDDEVETRYLLTPAFMERAVQLAELVGKGARLRFAFADDHLLVAVSGWNLFETASLAHAMTDPIHVQTFLNEVGLLLDIVDTLKLTLETRV